MENVKVYKDDYSDLVRVLDQFVLVKQQMIKKKTLILTDAAQSDKDKFDYSFTVVQKGANCKLEINLGDSPVFSEYVKFNGLRILDKTDAGMTSLVIVHENDIIACNLQPE